MAQRIVFPMLPKVDDSLFIDKMNRLFYFIDEQRPTARELREFMQEQEIWDRELQGDEFWEFYGIKKEKRYRLDRLASRLLDSRNDLAGWKEILFRHVMRENEILTKYVFDALAERLHSDAELYRYLTSYVYPGQKLRRPEFLAYLKLMSILGYIRIVGIRWSLGEPGKEMLKHIEQIDVESLLEEERQEQTGGGEDEDEDDDEDEEELARKLTRKRPAAARSGDDGEDEPPRRPSTRPADAEEDEAESPRAASAEEGEDEAPRQAARGEQRGEETEVRPELPPRPPLREPSRPAPSPAVSVPPSAPAPIVPPQPAPGLPAAAIAAPQVLLVEPEETLALAEFPRVRRLARRLPPRPFGPAQVAENVERLRSWWEEYELRELRRATDFGLSPLAHELAPQAFLFEMVSLATLLIGDPREADRWSFVNQLERVRFFPRLLEDGAALYPLLQELGFFAADAGLRLLSENLATLLRHREQLARQPELSTRLADIGEGEELIRVLRETFFDGLPGSEPHWVVREMVLLGLWKAPALRGVAAVPQRPVRQAAFRLGLLDSPHAANARDLLEASRQISAVLGPECAFDEPLFHLGRELGCKESCPSASTCPYHCRESYDLA